MGFLRRLAQNIDFKERKRQAMTRYYEESATLNYMESKHGARFHTAEDRRRQSLLVEQMRLALKEEFQVSI